MSHGASKSADVDSSPSTPVSPRGRLFHSATMPFSRRSLSMSSAITVSLRSIRARSFNRRSFPSWISPTPPAHTSVPQVGNKQEAQHVTDKPESRYSRHDSTFSLISGSSLASASTEHQDLSQVLSDYPPTPQYHYPCFDVTPPPSPVEQREVFLSITSSIHQLPNTAAKPSIQGSLYPSSSQGDLHLTSSNHAVESLEYIYDQYWLTAAPEPFAEEEQNWVDPAHNMDWRQFHAELMDVDV